MTAQTGLRPVAIAVAVAALLALAIGGAVLFGSGPEPSPTPMPSATASPTDALIDLPPAISDFATAAPGRYTMRGPGLGGTAGWPRFVTATLPAGWTQNSVSRGSGIFKAYPDNIQAGLSMWSVANVVAHGCYEWPLDPEMIEPPVGPYVEELAAAVGTIPGVRATPPVAAAVDGFDGVRMSVTVPAQAKCDFFALWESPTGGGEAWRYEQPPGWRNEIWIVDVNGLRFLIVAASAPDAPAVLLRELDQMVASIDIVP